MNTVNSLHRRLHLSERFLLMIPFFWMISSEQNSYMNKFALNKFLLHWNTLITAYVLEADSHFRVNCKRSLLSGLLGHYNGQSWVWLILWGVLSHRIPFSEGIRSSYGKCFMIEMPYFFYSTLPMLYLDISRPHDT